MYNGGYNINYDPYSNFYGDYSSGFVYNRPFGSYYGRGKADNSVALLYDNCEILLSFKVEVAILIHPALTDANRLEHTFHSCVNKSQE